MNEDQAQKYISGLIEKAKIKALNIIAVEAGKAIRKNFEQGGRPDSWKPSIKKGKLKGTKTLVVTGNLSNVGINIDKDKSQVIITTNPLSRAYARVQQEGGSIDMPARVQKFRKKNYKNGSSRTVFASSKHARITAVKTFKPYKINIPARPYMIIPQADIDTMTAKITENI